MTYAPAYTRAASRPFSEDDDAPHQLARFAWLAAALAAALVVWTLWPTGPAFPSSGRPALLSAPVNARAALDLANGLPGFPALLSPVSAAPAAPAVSLRGEWVGVGPRVFDRTSRAQSVALAALSAGAPMGEGLTLAGASVLRVKSGGLEVSALALYAAEWPGMAFVVAPPLLGAAVDVPPRPTASGFALSQACRACWSRV